MLDAFLAQGELKSGYDGEVRRPLQAGTERNYDRAGGL
jgi:hypothetical protein